jgi:hypothetical protein
MMQPPMSRTLGELDRVIRAVELYVKRHPDDPASSAPVVWIANEIELVVVRPESIADGRCIVQERVVGELPHEKVGNVCP